MKRMPKRLRGADGTGMVEYALVLIVIGLIVLFIAHRLGKHIRARFGAIKSTTNVTLIAPGRHIEVEDNDLTGTAKSVEGAP
jgi:Flp pilus assembly pilin Flp